MAQTPGAPLLLSLLTKFSSPSLKDRPALLAAMVEDQENRDDIYRAGDFWRQLNAASIRDIAKLGIHNFRGKSSGIGWGFTDCTFYETESLAPRQEAILRDTRTHALLSKYAMPDTMLGGCVNFVQIGGRRIASHYLNLLEQHDRVSHVYKAARSMFEIGGGFGANIHIALENHPRLRKVLYLDIPPNLYIGTQYLKAFYGSAVRDYLDTRHLPSIRFSDDDRLEIICIAPWQIERVKASLDLFHNAHSFVEMPRPTVANYAKHVMRLLKPSGAIVLLTYDCFDLSTTFHPEELPTFFPSRTFSRAAASVLDGRYGVISLTSQFSLP